MEYESSEQLTARTLDDHLLELTDYDPNGRFLLQEFVRLVDEHPTWTEAERSRIHHALELMYEAHGDQDRGNGDAYITHPLRVAIDLYHEGASARLVCAGLLHDAPEDRAQAVSEYLMHEAAPIDQAVSMAWVHSRAPSAPSRSDYIELSLTLLYQDSLYLEAAPLIDEVTNRAYPVEIDTITDPVLQQFAKHAYRAEQIKRHARAGGEEAALKFFDTYDNVRSLTRHEALQGDAALLPRLEKLIEKYQLMIKTWCSIQAELPPEITPERLRLCQERLAAVSERQRQETVRHVLGASAVTEVEKSVA